MKDETKIWLDYSKENLESSKYPVINVLQFYKHNEEICQKGIKIAESVLNYVQTIVK